MEKLDDGNILIYEVVIAPYAVHKTLNAIYQSLEKYEKIAVTQEDGELLIRVVRVK